MTWRSRKTAINAVAIKVIVTTIERPDSLEMPQTPWPLVQPFPSTDPKPTSTPETARSGRFFVIVWTGAWPLIKIQTGTEIKSPITNTRPCEKPWLAPFRVSMLDKIPLMPAILPFVAISKTADAPIKPPPSRDTSGVNSVCIRFSIKSQGWVIYSRPCIKVTTYVQGANLHPSEHTPLHCDKTCFPNQYIHAILVA